MSVIEVEGLRKEYRRFRKGRTLAVDGLDLSVPEGGVFGFLGPNGSGKTTTIRCLLGLIHPSAGRCTVLGVDAQRDLPTVIAKIGSIVEAPAMFPGFSGRKNLRLLGAVDGIGAKAVDAALERVDLAERGGDLVKHYSLGMKQRLGIAAALLKDPSLLILDEPANGLDPAGIVEIRQLLRRLGDEGRTVFVSSHLLSEVQHICDGVAILSHGRLVRAGAVADVLASGHAAGLIVKLDDLEAGEAALRAKGIQVVREADHLRAAVAPEEAATVSKILAGKRLYLTELRPDQADLETVFLELTSDHDPVTEQEGTP